MQNKIQIISLKTQKQFNEVNKLGKKLVGRSFIIILAHNYATSPKGIMHLGMKVGRNLGSAVIRNKMKRRIRYMTREIYKESTEQFHNSAIIVIPKSHSVKKKYSELFDDFKSLITRHI
ncbi:MAG: Ribonuclease [Pseudomonadota bacterium]|jgi:ribonuclease P protein component